MSFNIEVKGKYLLSHKNRMGIFNLDEEVHVCRLILQKKTCSCTCTCISMQQMKISKLKQSDWSTWIYSSNNIIYMTRNLSPCTISTYI